jgi:hypothetical protein
MPYRDWFRNVFSARPVADEGSDEIPNEAVVAEEGAAAPDEGADDVKRMETMAGGAAVPGIAGSAAAEAAEAQLASEAAPPDPTP